MPGAGAPAAARVVVVNTRVSHHGHTGTPGIPRAMVLTVSFVLSPVIGLCCHRRSASNPAKLDASVEASGPHDFAVRISAIRQRRYQRPPHPVPTSVTIAKRPSVGRDVRIIVLIWGSREKEYFFGEDWTRERDRVGLSFDLLVG
jgi:hypothetical protein